LVLARSKLSNASSRAVFKSWNFLIFILSVQILKFCILIFQILIIIIIFIIIIFFFFCSNIEIFIFIGSKKFFVLSLSLLPSYFFLNLQTSLIRYVFSPISESISIILFVYFTSPNQTMLSDNH
jgi:hypothetical protein